MQVFALRTDNGRSNFREVLKQCFVANLSHLNGQGNDEMDPERLVTALLEDSANFKGTSTVRELEGYLLNREDSAQYAVIEEDYIDRDFLDDFNSYHSRCFRNHSRKCCRVHFFSKKINGKGELEDCILKREGCLLNHKDLQEAYLGFMIIRPLRKTVVGRTCLKPYIRHDADNGIQTDRHYPAVCKNEVSFFGVNLKVEGMPFQEQDGSTAACATCALWSAFSVSARLFKNRAPSPSAITALAVENSFSSSRKFPNHGLTVEEMCYAIRKNGLDPIVVQLENYSDSKVLSYMFLGAIYAYLNLGVSVIAILDSKGKSGCGDTNGVHAIAINGYNLLNEDDVKGLPDFWKWSTAMHIDKIYANDDQCCPGARFMPKLNVGPHLKLEAYRGPSRHSELYQTYTPRSLIIPLYHKIHVTFEEVAHEVRVCVDLLTKAVEKENLSQGKVPIQLDITLRESKTIKSLLIEDPEIPSESKLEIIESSLPRFVWCVRFDYNGVKSVVVLIDTTDSEQGLTVVRTIVYPGSIADENDIVRLARFAYHNSHRRDFDADLRQKMDRQGIFSALCEFDKEKMLKDFTEQESDVQDLGEKAYLQYQLGVMHDYGMGVESDKDKARKWYEKAVENGSVDAAFNLGWMYEFGDGVGVNKNKAIELYEKICEEDESDISARFRLAESYEQSNDCDNALKMYLSAAVLGHAESQYRLAVRLYARKKFAEAVKWYEKAVALGHIDAQHELGMMYKHHMPGVQWSFVRAAELLVAPARQGISKSQCELAKILMVGAKNADGKWVVLPNKPMAFMLCKESAEQGYVAAQLKVAQMYRFGLGVTISIDKAIAWYEAVVGNDNSSEYQRKSARRALDDLSRYSFNFGQ